MNVNWLRYLNWQLVCIALVAPAYGEMSVQEIIQKSVQANQSDYQAGPNYTYKETDRTGNSTKTYQVIMIDGSPYNRLIAENGQPLTGERDREEEHKLKEVKAERDSESPGARKKRIEKYEQGRRRDNEMRQQLTVAFSFKLMGEHQLSGFEVYVLRATPKPGYKPPNLDTQVLPGMTGELWIDQKTYDWVKVVARVIHQVSIEGFLAEVEPGTRFELEKRPVGDGIWMPSHFSMYSNAKVLFLFSHNSQQNQTFSDYKRIH